MTSLQDRRYVPIATSSRRVVVEREISEIAHGCWLVEAGGTYAIMNEGRLILKFPSKPTPDPDPENIHEDGPILDASVRWTDEVMEWIENTRVKPEIGYELCKAAIKSGWSPEEDYGYVLMWFYNEAGKALEEEGDAS